MSVALSKMTGKAVVVEQRFEGERVQIHKLGDCVAIYGPDLQDMGRSLSTADMDAVRAALNVKGCILDAVLQRDEEGLYFLVFDCLWLNGRALTRESLRQRHDALNRAVRPCEFLQVPPREEFPASTPPTSEVVTALREEASSLGCSGLMFKCLDEKYEAGRTSESWLALVPSQQQVKGTT